MPYIENSRRDRIKLGLESPFTAGDLNYLYTLNMLAELRKNLEYATFDRILGKVLNSAPAYHIPNLPDHLYPWEVRKRAEWLAFLEFYRRVGIYYEDLCIEKNGDLEEYEQMNELISKKFGKAST